MSFTLITIFTTCRRTVNKSNDLASQTSPSESYYRVIEKEVDPRVGSQKLEIGNWKLEDGRWNPNSQPAAKDIMKG